MNDFSIVQFVKRHRLRLAASCAALLTAAAVFIGLMTSPAGDGGSVHLIDCPKGAPLYRVAMDMESRGIIRSARIFVWLARIKGDDGKVQAGTYQLNDGLSPGEILSKMVAGEVYAVRFAVPEGYSIHQVAELLEGKKIYSKAEFLAACSNRELLQELKIPGPTVEGYLHPSTYSIPPQMKPEECIRMMVAHFERVNADLFAQLPAKGGLTRHQVVTLASLVEKEAVDARERPLIASVFFNRLKKRMRLQSDPTAVYGVRAFGGSVSREDLQRRTPYNTYLIDGLPPGAIGNPSSAALQAVLSPSSTPYFYFVAKKDGTHFFSATLDQHNRAVTTYLKGASVRTHSNQSRAEYRNDNPSLTGGR
jgi:UPF0755 protein